MKTLYLVWDLPLVPSPSVYVFYSGWLFIRGEGLPWREKDLLEAKLQNEIFFCYRNGLFKNLAWAKDKVSLNFIVMTFRQSLFGRHCLAFLTMRFIKLGFGIIQVTYGGCSKKQLCRTYVFAVVTLLRTWFTVSLCPFVKPTVKVNAGRNFILFEESVWFFSPEKLLGDYVLCVHSELHCYQCRGWRLHRSSFLFLWYWHYPEFPWSWFLILIASISS